MAAWIVAWASIEKTAQAKSFPSTDLRRTCLLTVRPKDAADCLALPFLHIYIESTSFSRVPYCVVQIRGLSVGDRYSCRDTFTFLPDTSYTYSYRYANSMFVTRVVRASWTPIHKFQNQAPLQPVLAHRDNLGMSTWSAALAASTRHLLHLWYIPNSGSGEVPCCR